MLFGNTNIKRAVGEGRAKAVEPGSARHCGGNRDDFFVAPGFGNQRLGKNCSVAWRPRRCLGLNARHDIKLLDTVIFVVGGLGIGIAFALLRHDMDQARPFGGVADIFEHGDQMFEIMTIDWPDIIKAKLFK